MSINDIPLQRLKDILASDIPLTIVTTEALIARLEQAEAAVARVREVMTDWECDEDSKGLHFDLTHALDGEQS